MITNCTKCGRLHEVSSTEAADDPKRLCLACFYLSNEAPTYIKCSLYGHERPYIQKMNALLCPRCGDVVSELV
jgi:phage FluMu protein Com